jgi:hypothetical protein
MDKYPSRYAALKMVNSIKDFFEADFRVSRRNFDAQCTDNFFQAGGDKENNSKNLTSPHKPPYRNY